MKSEVEAAAEALALGVNAALFLCDASLAICVATGAHDFGWPWWSYAALGLVNAAAAGLMFRSICRRMSEE